MDNIYKLDLALPHIALDAFKEKNYNILVSIICNNRLGQYLKSPHPANAEFEEADNQCWHPIVTVLDKFCKSETNCVIFDLHVPHNEGVYDKIFIYHSGDAKSGQYGFVAYNTNTEQSDHIYGMDNTYDGLSIHLTQYIEYLSKKKIFDYYNKKYDALQNKHGLSIDDVPPYAEYLELEAEAQKPCI